MCWQTEPSGKTAFFTTETFSSQKTCNTKIVANFLHFPFITHMLKSDKQRKSYHGWNTVHKWKNLEYRFWFGLTMISQNSADWIWCRIRRNVQCESDREFWGLSRKHKCTPIRPMVQELRSPKGGGGSVLDRSNCLDNFGFWAQFHKNSGWTLNTKILENFVSFLTVGKTQNFDLGRRNYDQLKLNGLLRYDFSLPVNFQVSFDFTFC
jgi:hypothetical protein